MKPTDPDTSLNGEQQLLQQLSQGDKRALQQLFDQYYVNLCRVALRLVHRSEIAEEIVQDVFIYLWEKRGQWQITISVAAYLSQAVRNRSLNHLKSKAARYDWAAIIEEHQHPVQTSPAEDLQFSELSQVVERAVQSLPAKCQLVYSLSRYEECTYREIAEQLGVSVKTVEYYMGQALKHLRYYLEQHGYSAGCIIFLYFL